MGRKWCSDENGVVLNGYDVVAYHTEDRAVWGSSEHSTEYEGGTFYFSTAHNLKAFLKSPGDYLPAFDGWCAYGVLEKHFTQPDPECFKIYNGELLVFFNRLHEGVPVNTKVLWNADEANFYELVSGYYPEMVQ